MSGFHHFYDFIYLAVMIFEEFIWDHIQNTSTFHYVISHANYKFGSQKDENYALQWKEDEKHNLHYSEVVCIESFECGS